MIRMLYAGYLAFALYLLYPMLHNTLDVSMDCVLSALPGGERNMPQRTASDAQVAGVARIRNLRRDRPTSIDCADRRDPSVGVPAIRPGCLARDGRRSLTTSQANTG